MKLLALLIMLNPMNDLKDHRELPLRGPLDHHLVAREVGIYGDNGEKRRGELWKHDRLEFYEVVLRHPYEEIPVEDDGIIFQNKKWTTWGGW